MRPITTDYADVPSVPTSYVTVPGWSFGGFANQQEQPRVSEDGAIAAGKNAMADGIFAVAFGDNSQALGRGAVACGSGCRSHGANCVAMGSSCYAEITDSSYGPSVALGWNCAAQGAVAVGSGVSAQASSIGVVHVGISTDDRDTPCKDGTCVGIDCTANPGYAVGKNVWVNSDETAFGIGEDLIVTGRGAGTYGKALTNNTSESYFFMSGLTTPKVGTGSSTGFMRNHVMYWEYVDLPAGPTVLTALQFTGQTILRNTSGVACAATTPSASQLRARFSSARVGDYFDVFLINPTAAVNFTLTYGAGMGGGAYTLPGARCVGLRFIFTDVTAGAATMTPGIPICSESDY